MPLENVALQGAKVSFVIGGVPGCPTLARELSPDGQSLSGSFTQEGQSFPFKLSRAAAPATASTDRTAAMDAYLAAQMKERKIPGIAVAIFSKGQVLFSKGNGMANLEHQVPLTPETVFQSGSTGKQYTAMAVLMLLEEASSAWVTAFAGISPMPRQSGSASRSGTCCRTPAVWAITPRPSTCERTTRRKRFAS